MPDPRDEAREAVARGPSEPPVGPLRRAVQPGVLLADRFEVIDKLGAGGMGQVFAAFDRTRQTRVAIKIIGRLTPRSIQELKREFRAASELVHPNLVPLHQLFCDDVEWLFSMDLVEGVTLPALGQGRPLPDGLLRQILRQLAVALSVLHQAGTTHGDLKPSNFLITPDRRVVLLDFGLARPIGAVQHRDFAGTPGYMPPEQYLGEALTEAADWYSFGVVLYEALTGALPFRHPLDERLAGAPADLRELCLELLRFAPGDRPTGEDVLRRLDVDPTETRFSGIFAVSRRGGLVNRHAELAALHRALQAARGGQTSVALLHGPSGIGKTALVEQFVQTACTQGARLLASRCRERESMGYKAADGLVDDIVRFLDGLDEAEAATLVPDGIEDLIVLFPMLNAAGAVERAPKRRPEMGDQAALRGRAIAAFHRLFERMSERVPLIVWMDDLQWSDAESALLLGPLLRPSRALSLLFIGAYRTTPQGRGPMLDALFDGASAFPAPTEIALAPLSPEASERLALESLPRDEPNAPALARDIGRDTGGHPLFIAELAHAVGRAEGPAVGTAPSTLLDLVANRVAALPTDARRLLELTAVAGVPLSRSVLRQSLGLGFAPAEQALDLLRALRLVRSHGPNEDDAIDTHHDRIREIVAQRVDDADRKGHHAGLARVLQENPRTKPDLLAVHHQGAGDLVRAGRYWIAAADQALRALAFEHAADLYGKGLQLAVLEPSERLAVQIRRAEALGFAGRGPSAADAFLEASASCGRDEALELRRRAAEQLLLSGHLARGLRVIDGVLESLGMRQGRGDPRDFFAVAKGRLLVRLRGLSHVARTEGELPREELARLDASWTLACSLSLIDPMRGATFQSRHLLLALEAGEPRRLLRALTLEISYAATPGVGSERRTARVLDVADALVQDQGDYPALALLALARGIAAYLQGQVGSALTHVEAALKLLTERCVGAVWETLSAQRFVIAALFFQGRLRRLGEFVGPVLAAAEGTGNLYATMCLRLGYTTVAWLARDRVDEVRRQIARARDEWKDTGAAPLFLYNVTLGETFVDLYTGRAESALARIRAQWSIFEDAKLHRISVLRVQSWHLLGASMCQVVEGLARRGPTPRASGLCREVRRIARSLRAERITRGAPLADLLESAIDWRAGDIHGAERRLRRCVAAFDDLEMRLFSAAARVRLGELTADRAGEALASDGYAEFDREGGVNASRMVDLLEPGFGPAGRSTAGV
jgi:eukaryotic-like serine/threonine-protein kinase